MRPSARVAAWLRERLARARGEAGVSAVVLSLSVALVIIPLGAMAVDLGVQRVARQDMQSVADVLALDLARDLKPGQPVSSYNISAMEDKAATRAQEQGNIGKNIRFVVQLGDVDPTKYGMVDASGKSLYFRQMTGSQIPTAVRVIVASDVDFAMAAGLPDGGVSQGSAARSAIAGYEESKICYTAGMNWFTFNSDKTLLGPLLKNILSVQFGVLNPDGLVALKNVEIPLIDLATSINVMSPDAALSSEITLGDFQIAAVDALKKNSIAEVSALEALHLNVPGGRFQLGDLVGLGVGSDIAGAHANINLLDLFSAAVVVSNGSAGFDLPISVFGKALQVRVTMVQPPQFSCSTTGSAKAAQFKFTVTVQLPERNDGFLGIGASNPANAPSGFLGGKIELTFSSGSGEVRIKGDPKCGVSPSVLVEGDAIGASLTGRLEFKINYGDLLSWIPGWGLVSWLIGSKVSVVAQMSAAAGATFNEQTTVTSFPSKITIPKHGQSNALKLGFDPNYNPPLTFSVDGLVGDIINALGLVKLLNYVLSGLQGMINTIASAAITPVMNLILGATGTMFGSVDVDFPEPPTCGGVKLLG